MTPEQLSRISDKLDNLLGEGSGDAPQGEGSEVITVTFMSLTDG